MHVLREAARSAAEIFGIQFWAQFLSPVSNILIIRKEPNFLHEINYAQCLSYEILKAHFRILKKTVSHVREPTA